jgi:hypothetical protein
MAETWSLVVGTEIVGTIEVNAIDMPWLIGKLSAQPAFDEFRGAFAEELGLVEGDLDTHVDEWEAIYQTITNKLRLYRPDGTAVPEYLLHVRGDEAWFRYSDEPFET